MKEGRIEKQNKIEEDGIEIVPEEGGVVFDSDAPEKKVKKLKEEIKVLKEESAKRLDGWKRTEAGRINFEKMITREKEEGIRFANLKLVLDLLPTIDTLDEALKHFKNDPESSKTAEQEGVKKTYDKLIDALESNGVEKINAVGEKFNPEFHEVVEVVEGEEPGIIVEEVQKGYSLHGKTIRPSKVKVGK